MRKLLAVDYIPRICRLTSDQLSVQASDLYKQAAWLRDFSSSFAMSILKGVLQNLNADYRSAKLEMRDHDPKNRDHFLERISFLMNFVEAYRAFRDQVAMVGGRDSQSVDKKRQAGA